MKNLLMTLLVAIQLISCAGPKADEPVARGGLSPNFGKGLKPEVGLYTKSYSRARHEVGADKSCLFEYKVTEKFISEVKKTKDSTKLKGVSRTQYENLIEGDESKCSWLSEIGSQESSEEEIEYKSIRELLAENSNHFFKEFCTSGCIYSISENQGVAEVRISGNREEESFEIDLIVNDESPWLELFSQAKVNVFNNLGDLTWEEEVEVERKLLNKEEMSEFKKTSVKNTP